MSIPTLGTAISPNCRLGGMADRENRAEATDQIGDGHDALRRRFVALWDLRPAGDPVALVTVWQPLASLLEVRASAEEEIFYPASLKRGGDRASKDTNDATGDHNQIRNAIRAARESETCSEVWWEAALARRMAHDEHFADEDCDVSPDFREHADEALRLRVGARWVAFHAEHRGTGELSGDDIDEQEHVVENS